jgi:predicted secreted protein
MKINRTIIIYVMLAAVASIMAGTVISVALSETPVKNKIKTTYLTERDIGSTVSVRKGDMLNLTLQDHGDGGYTWTITKIDEKILGQVDQFNWGSSGALGDFGKDTWIFSAKNIGTTTLQLECKRPWTGGDTCETISVNIEVN